MTVPQRKWLHHTTPSWVNEGSFFITICCQQRGTSQLCLPDISAKLFEAVQLYHEKQRWYVSLWLLMPDHIHALVACPQNESLAKWIAAWKRHTSRNAGIEWQKGFFDHRLRKAESFEEKATYIWMNPVRKGLVESPEGWPYVWRPKYDDAGADASERRPYL